MPGRGTPLEVVGGDCLDGPALPGFRFSIGERLGGGDGLRDCGRRDNLRIRLADFFDGVRIHVIAVDVGDQDEVGFGQTRKLRRFGGIQIDRLASRLDQRAGVVERGDLNRTSGGFEYLRLGIRRCTEPSRQQQERDES